MKIINLSRIPIFDYKSINRSASSEVDMATFSPQPSSSAGSSNVPAAAFNVATTTSSVSSASGAVIANPSEPSTSRALGISSSSTAANQLSSSSERSHQQGVHGEISNPPSPLGGRPLASTSSTRPVQRPDSPQAGPSGIKRTFNSVSSSGASRHNG